MKTLQLSLACRSISVVLDDGAGKLVDYDLREMTAEARDRYLEALDKRTVKGPDGKAIGMVRYQGLQADLLTCCLFRSGSQTPVTEAEVQQWPATVVGQIFDAARELNRLAGEEEAVKNE